jgi:hypothetical protein
MIKCSVESWSRRVMDAGPSSGARVRRGKSLVGRKTLSRKTFTAKVRPRRRYRFPVPGPHAVVIHRETETFAGKEMPRGPFEGSAPHTFTGWPARRRGFSRRQYICPAHVIRAFRRPGAHTVFGVERALWLLAAAWLSRAGWGWRDLGTCTTLQGGRGYLRHVVWVTLCGA